MCADYGMNFIRIGVNVNAVELAEIYVERAKKHNMYVAINFMKSYTLPPKEFSKLVVLAQQYGADIAYLVDSAGNMVPDEIKEYYDKVIAENTIPLGFHGHNNLGLASANALVAFKCGAAIIDTSLQGMGRCTGNTVTEHFISLLDKMEITHRFDLLGLMDISEKYVRPHIIQTGWDSVDIICGLAGFHSSYMNVIKKYAVKYDVDPRKLIIEVCLENRLDAPDDLVESKAKILKELAIREDWVHKFPLDKYFGNEQKKSSKKSA
jgi:4-hydroxy-2-oxovalerate aldolase